MGIVVGLVVGKAFGVMAGAYLVARLTRATLNPDMTWADVVAGSLLVGELVFGAGTPTQDHATIGVLTGSVLAALLAAITLG